MNYNLVPCLDLIITENEGGYSDNPKDPGGPTNMGVTIKTLTAWRSKQAGKPVEVSKADVMALQKDEVVAIFSAEYAAPIHFDDLPAGLDYAVLDCAINSGPARAAEILQSLLKVGVDGIIGAQTLTALAKVDAGAQRRLIEDYTDARLTFLKTLKTWSEFGNGWYSRITRVEQRAMVLANGKTPDPVKPIVVVDFDDQHDSAAGTAKATGPTKLLSTEQGKHAAAVLGSATLAVGAAATQASQVLAAYDSIHLVHLVLVGLAMLSAVGTFVGALRKPAQGAA